MISFQKKEINEVGDSKNEFFSRYYLDKDIEYSFVFIKVILLLLLMVSE